MANRDALTGAYIRRYLASEGEILLEHAYRYGHNLSVIVLDLDTFKKVNDTYGVTGSLGVVTTPGDTKVNLNELPVAADAALYEAKHAGGN